MMVAKYRKQNPSIFDKHVNLDDNHYKLTKWVQKVSKDSPYSGILETTQLNQSTLSYGKNVDTILILSYL
jgi:hypothetical protein